MKRKNRLFIRKEQTDDNFLDPYAIVCGKNSAGSSFFIYDEQSNDVEPVFSESGEWINKCVPLSIRRGYNTLHAFSKEMRDSEDLIFGQFGSKKVVAICFKTHPAELTNAIETANAYSMATGRSVYIDQYESNYSDNLDICFCIPLPTDMETLRREYAIMKEYMEASVHVSCRFQVTVTINEKFLVPKEVMQKGEEAVNDFLSRAATYYMSYYNTEEFIRKADNRGHFIPNSIEIK